VSVVGFRLLTPIAEGLSSIRSQISPDKLPKLQPKSEEKSPGMLQNRSPVQISVLTHELYGRVTNI
jgi:hypothetical protein